MGQALLQRRQRPQQSGQRLLAAAGHTGRRCRQGAGPRRSSQQPDHASPLRLAQDRGPDPPRAACRPPGPLARPRLRRPGGAVPPGEKRVPLLQGGTSERVAGAPGVAARAFQRPPVRGGLLRGGRRAGRGAAGRLWAGGGRAQRARGAPKDRVRRRAADRGRFSGVAAAGASVEPARVCGDGAGPGELREVAAVRGAICGAGGVEPPAHLPLPPDVARDVCAARGAGAAVLRAQRAGVWPAGGAALQK